MNKPTLYRALFFLCAFLPLRADAQLPDDLADRTYRLHNHLQSNHLRPRERNDAYGRDVHARLLALLDPEYHIFQKSDIETLNAAADSLDNDIIRKEMYYLDLFTALYRTRLEETRTIIGEITAKQPNMQSLRLDIEEYKDYAANYSERKARWERSFLKDFEEDLLDELKDSTLTKARIDEAVKNQWEAKVTQFKEHIEGKLDFEEYFDLYFLNAMTLAYDPHSSYFNDEMNEQFTEELSSTHLVFGITYQQNLNGDIEITEILPGSSAWFSEEVVEGAVLVEIRAASGQMLHLEGANTQDLSGFFDVLESDTIELDMLYEGEARSAQLVRSRVYSDNDIIKTAVLDGPQKIGYISLPDFYTSWTDTSALGCANDVAKAILKLKKAEIEGLILDLRDNGGGSLYEAVDLVGIFIDFGPVLLIEDASGNISPMKDFNRGAIYSGPLMVLINAESASASEVVAGTLQDYHRALIAGHRSFGKATGQGILPLDPRMMFMPEDAPSTQGFVKTTDIGLYRLSKETAQLKGVLPDIEFRDLSAYEAMYEEDEPHAIALGEIDKKVYFTPLETLPTEQLKDWYAQREVAWLDSLQSLYVAQETLIEDLIYHLDLAGNHARLQQFESLEKQAEALCARNPVAFSAQSYQFDEELLRISPYLGEYNRRFIEGLHSDVELSEAYQLMQKWSEIK